jgi:hypothetical protein
MSKLKTSKAALCKSLLNGDILNVRNVHQNIGLSNCSREIIRMVEKPFNVKVDRRQVVGHTRYGTSASWFDYQLKRNELNKEGIRLMEKYVKDNTILP